MIDFARAVAITDNRPYREIAEYLAGWRDHTEAAFRTLSYVDGVNLAKRAVAPALFSVALMDLTCPPSTVLGATATRFSSPALFNTTPMGMKAPCSASCSPARPRAVPKSLFKSS